MDSDQGYSLKKRVAAADGLEGGEWKGRLCQRGILSPTELVVEKGVEIEGGMHYADVRLLVWEPRAYEIYDITTMEMEIASLLGGIWTKDQIRGNGLLQTDVRWSEWMVFSFPSSLFFLSAILSLSPPALHLMDD